MAQTPTLSQPPLSSHRGDNIKEAEGRGQAINEAVRVLKPNGILLIADFRSTQQYAHRLRELGMSEVIHRHLGWQSWFGGPWASIKLVSACKPA
jgi:ubiquinone/menaquinone biosynthesis C-methylase UbiE